MSNQSSVKTALVDIEFPLFEEATQTAARFLDIPICFVGIAAQDRLILKAAVGLSRLGLMNPLARTRRLALSDSLVQLVVENKRSLVLPHISDRLPQAQSVLVQEYGIQSYLGIPLLTADGHCLGVLAVIDVQPHEFSADAIAFMELLARWSVSEYERQQLAETLARTTTQPTTGPTVPSPPSKQALLDTVRLTLMSQLTQDMRNPLTTITGMASMLSREIYGALTAKQREYADIVRDSSQYLLAIANEVLELSGLDAQIQPLQPAPVDIDMIGQQVERMLVAHAGRKNLELRFTVEPGSRLWTLDRDLVRQSLYHVLFCIIQLAGEAGTLQIHCTERDSSLSINIWMTHPWLGEGLPNAVAKLYNQLGHPEEEAEMLTMLLARATGRASVPLPEHQQSPSSHTNAELPKSRELLSLLLSRHLIERHHGTLALQGSADAGYRLVMTLPFLKSATAADSAMDL
jgi:signal transduction histidine kinase